MPPLLDANGNIVTFTDGRGKVTTYVTVFHRWCAAWRKSRGLFVQSLFCGRLRVTNRRMARLFCMKLSDDLPHANWMYLKAALFFVAGSVATIALFLQAPTLQTAFLLAVCAWSFCRLYYFLFYVLERYIDPSFRFDGIGSAVRYLLSRRRP